MKTGFKATMSLSGVPVFTEICKLLTYSPYHKWRIRKWNPTRQTLNKRRDLFSLLSAYLVAHPIDAAPAQLEYPAPQYLLSFGILLVISITFKLRWFVNSYSHSVTTAEVLIWCVIIPLAGMQWVVWLLLISVCPK